jgi:hypothetical protein
MKKRKEKHEDKRNDTHLRERWYNRLVARDGGEYCRHCHREPPEVFLEIDHTDGNKNHDPIDGSNYQLLCRPCNRKKNPRGKGKQKRIHLTTQIIDQPKEMSAEMKKSKSAKPAFQAWLYDKLYALSINGSGIELEEAINSGAWVARCSTITIKRYIASICSEEGFAFISCLGDKGPAIIYLKTKTKRGISSALLYEPEPAAKPAEL